MAPSPGKRVTSRSCRPADSRAWTRRSRHDGARQLIQNGGCSPLSFVNVLIHLLKGNRMSKTIAVFGAGPGMGRSVARRFGREGFQVALVARNQTRLDAYTGELAADGITAAGFAGDLADR